MAANTAKLIAMALRGQPVSHADLYNAREGANPQQQQVLGPLEHQAFAREFAQESPLAAAVSLPFAIPAYTIAKALHMLPGSQRSPASLDEIKLGYKGLAQGLFGNGQ